MEWNQVTFDLPKIAVEDTKKVVEDAFEKYRRLLFTVPNDKLPKITTTYSLTPPSQTNEFHSTTEDAAIYNVERNLFMKSIESAVNRLNGEHRAILIQCYMQKERTKDCAVALELDMSSRTFYREKKEAIINIANALGIAVYESEVKAG
ncbi:ArpU family phage packaging/lysis transcriptional regulator [Chengkuizengella sp. SCS-71B]|uniref:ArpU family phage packaging/lysis transcriptional regulator n=1 Tax=Chengkuizengella sp. SCS-71B TaxID=3115290 RepID=UPI0032C21540